MTPEPSATDIAQSGRETYQREFVEAVVMARQSGTPAPSAGL